VKKKNDSYPVLEKAEPVGENKNSLEKYLRIINLIKFVILTIVVSPWNYYSYQI